MNAEQSTYEQVITGGEPVPEQCGDGGRGSLLTPDYWVQSDRMRRTQRSKRWRKFQRRAMLEQRFAGLSTMQCTFGSKFTWLAQVALTGSAYNPTTNQGGINKFAAKRLASASTLAERSRYCLSLSRYCARSGW